MAEMLPGDVIADRFELGPVIGQGGYGRVYRAIDYKVGDEVAVKVALEPQREYSETGEPVILGERYPDPSDNIISEREIGSLLSYVRPDLFPRVRAAIADRQGRFHALVMELVQGKSLSLFILERKSVIAEEEAIPIMIRICEILHTIHECGLIARDFKPDDLIVLSDGTVKMVDFGYKQTPFAVRQIAQRGSSFGTILYSFPEMFACQSDERSDLYVLGLIFYKIFCADASGNISFRLNGGVLSETSVQDLWSAVKFHVQAKPYFPPSLNPQLEFMIAKLLKKNPKNRYGSAHEVQQQLAAYMVSKHPELREQEPYASALRDVSDIETLIPPAAPRDEPGVLDPFLEKAMKIRDRVWAVLREARDAATGIFEDDPSGTDQEESREDFLDFKP